MDSLLNMNHLKELTKMKYKIVLLVLVLLIIPIAIAEPSYIFKQDTDTNLKVSCFDISNELCNNAVSCYMTMHYPNQDNLYTNSQMLQSVNLDFFSHNLSGLSISGEYPVIIRCTGNTTGFSTFTVEVNPTGAQQTSILDNPMLLILGILAILLIGMGVSFNSAWFGFIGSVMFLLGGVYTMIYGFNNVTDLYTQGISLVFIGLGFIFMFLAAYEWIWGGKE